VIKDIAGDGETREGTIRHAFTTEVAVQSVNEDTGAVTFEIGYESALFNNGVPQQSFDSSKPDQRAKAKTYQPYYLWGAALSSKSKLRLTKEGRIEFFRLTSSDSSYDNRTTELLKQVLQENADYMAIDLPATAKSKGNSWGGQIPVKFIGGALGGNTIHVDVSYKWTKTESVNNENCAIIDVQLLKQPSLPISSDSIQGGEAHFSVDDFSGKLIFSLTHGNVLSFEGKMHTHFTLRISGELVDDHQMAYNFSLNRAD
jgi:hypothetical protein